MIAPPPQYRASPHAPSSSASASSHLPDENTRRASSVGLLQDRIRALQRARSTTPHDHDSTKSPSTTSLPTAALTKARTPFGSVINVTASHSPRYPPPSAKTVVLAPRPSLLVQLPTSDQPGSDESPARDVLEDAEQDQDDDLTSVMPTPPNSQSPQRAQKQQQQQQQQPQPAPKLAKAKPASRRSSTSLLAPPTTTTDPPPHAGPSKAKTTRRRSSISPSPFKGAPLHSPQVLAFNRRQSSGTPQPSPRGAASTPTNRRKSGGRRRSSLIPIVPTETLPVPIDQLERPESDSEDPILLKGGEEMRGRGEGRPRSASLALSRYGTSRRESIKKRASLADPLSRAPGDDENEDEVSSSTTPEPEKQQEPQDEPYDWNDHDLAPLGSGTIEEDLVDQYDQQPRMGEYGFDYGGHERDWVADELDETPLSHLDFAELKDQESDDDHEVEVEHDLGQEPISPAPPQSQNRVPSLPSLAVDSVIPLRDPSSSPSKTLPPIPLTPFRAVQLGGPSKPSPFLGTPMGIYRDAYQAEEEEQLEEEQQQRSSHMVVSPLKSSAPRGPVSEIVALTSPLRAAKIESMSPERPLPSLPTATATTVTGTSLFGQVWTRGPAFFRSSPSPSRSTALSSPHVDLLTMPVLLPPRSSPARPSLRSQEEQTDDEAAEDDVVLARSSSPAGPAPRSNAISPASIVDDVKPDVFSAGFARRRSPLAQAQPIRRPAPVLEQAPAPLRAEEMEDSTMRMATPPRSSSARAAADIHMSSPSPVRPVLSSLANEPSSAAPSTPDARMDSPNRTRSFTASRVPPSVERLQGSGKVQKGVDMLRQVLFVGTSSAPTTAPSAARRTARTRSTPVPARFNRSSMTPLASGHRQRPSHPTLPVVEITSTDPQAAARAAAILKVYHAYVEQGLSVHLPPTDGSPIVDEGDVRQLLDRAEGEVMRSVKKVPLGSVSAPSVAMSARSEGGRSVTDSWTSTEWRALEKTLIEEEKEAKKAGRGVTAKAVVWRFVDRVGVDEKELEGDWAKDKLVTRIMALQARRSQARSTRRTTLDIELSRAVDKGKQRAISPPSSPASSSDDGSERNVEDDTFFSRPAPAIMKSSKAEIRPLEEDKEEEEEAPIVPPLALASNRFAYLYDEAPIEKPKLPSQSWVPIAEEREVTPAPRDGDESIEAPLSTARKLIRYLGSFVRHSSPASSGTGRAAEEAADESYTSSSASPEPEMMERQLLSQSPVPTRPLATHLEGRKIAPLRPSLFDPPSPRPQAVSIHRRRSVTELIDALEEQESSREEESRLIDEMVRKRRAPSGDLRAKCSSTTTPPPTTTTTSGSSVSTSSASSSSKVAAPTVYMNSPRMIPSGTRATDRPIGERPRSKLGMI